MRSMPASAHTVGRWQDSQSTSWRLRLSKSAAIDDQRECTQRQGPNPLHRSQPCARLQILAGHVVSGKLTSGALLHDTVAAGAAGVSKTTLGGSSLVFTSANGTLYVALKGSTVGAAIVVTPDIVTCAGIVHIINKVLLPDPVAPAAATPAPAPAPAPGPLRGAPLPAPVPAPKPVPAPVPAPTPAPQPGASAKVLLSCVGCSIATARALDLQQ